MSEEVIPKTPEERAKRCKAYRRACLAVGYLSFVLAILAVAMLVGVVIAVFILEFSHVSPRLCYILMGSFGGAAVLSAIFALVAYRVSVRTEKRKNDFLERCDSEESFFVGEGTFATFAGEELVIHADGKERVIRVPYSDLRAFSLCTRRAPRELGEWSVVLEIPARYLSKQEKRGEPPALIQTDAKPRLYAVLERRGIPLFGETPPSGKPTKQDKTYFVPEKKMFLPNRKRRKRAIIIGAVGLVLVLGAIPLAIYEASVGALLGVFGVFLVGRSAYAYFRAKAVFAVYSQGILWRESERAESFFLKWEEIGGVKAGEHDGMPILSIDTLCGRYHIPRGEGFFEEIEKLHPEKTNGHTMSEEKR